MIFKVTATGILCISVISAAFAVTPAKMWSVHVVSFTGKVDKPGETGFKELTYPIRIDAGPSGRTFFYAEQTDFDNKQNVDGGVYYTGLQPQAGGAYLAVFSVFGKGVVKRDAHCTSDADGGAGATCLLNIPSFKKGATYRFSAVLQSSTASMNTWVGYVLDAATNKKIRIGSWSTPVNWGYLSGNHAGFVEDYVGISGCQDIPATTVWFGPGEGIMDGKTIFGKNREPHSGGVCKDKVSFQSVQEESGGVLIITRKGVK